jgi:hypothetical protein
MRKKAKSRLNRRGKRGDRLSKEWLKTPSIFSRVVGGFVCAMWDGDGLDHEDVASALTDIAEAVRQNGLPKETRQLNKVAKGGVVIPFPRR